MSRWLIGTIVVLGVALRPSRGAMLGIGGIFFLAQAMFPYAYAYQDYYFYSCAIFLNVAFAYVLFALWDSRVPRWLVAVLLAVPFVAQLNAYRQSYWVGQNVWAEGGYPVTNAIRDLTPKNSIIVVAGADWAAMAPLYSQRRALMVRNGLEYDQEYLNRAFDRLEGEDVSAVIIMNQVRTNRNFIDHVAQRFDLNAAAPSFSWAMCDVYIPRSYRKSVELGIKSSSRYPQITMPHTEEDDLTGNGVLQLSATVAHNAFSSISPAPHEAQFQFGLSWMAHGDGVVMSAHPDSDLWLRPPAGATQIKWGYGIFPGAYENPAKSTNGVEFIVDGEMPDGSKRRLYHRLLDPAQKPEDRGDQQVVIPYTSVPGEVLRFSTRANENSAFDWAYWIGVHVQ